MARKNSMKIMLESEAGTGSRYFTTKNFRTATGKMRVRKYDPVTRKHEWFVEKKLAGAKQPK